MTVYKTFFSSRILPLYFIVLLLACFITQSCKPNIEKPEKPEQTLTSSDFEGKAYSVPGRIQVILNEFLWHKKFKLNKEASIPHGIERLKLTPELSELFHCYLLKRVWRTFPQLELNENNIVTIISYPEYVKLKYKRKDRRKNAREYSPPDLKELQSYFELEFPVQTDLTALIRNLKKIKGVVSVNYVIEAIPLAPYFPNDPGWVADDDPIYDETLARGRWGFHNTGIELGENYLEDFDIDLPEAWEFQRGNSSNVVAVMDRGVDVSHPDLYLNIFLNNGEVPAWVVDEFKNASPDDGLPDELTFYDLNVESVIAELATHGWTDTNGNGFIDGEDVVSWWSDGPVTDDGNGYPDDLCGFNFCEGNQFPFELGPNGHGTQVAGLIAAIADNGLGISGVAPSVRILPIRSCFSISEVIYARDFPQVRIINHSASNQFNGGSLSLINSILSSLEPEGVLYVASLGNVNRFTYGGDPSRREEVVSISNFDSDGIRNGDGGSCFGPKTDIAAPGTNLYSLTAKTATSPASTGWFGGTSAASPVAAGVAALIASQDELLTPEQIRQVLRMTATDPASVASDRGENTPGWDLYSGWGFVNANNAISSLQSGEVYPEANILSLFENYRNTHRDDHFSIQNGTLDIRAYMGIPGNTVDFILRRSTRWDFSTPIVIANVNDAPYSDGTGILHSLNTDLLNQMRFILELDVETDEGVSGKDRAVIDLPRAYIANLKHEERIFTSLPLRGFAYDPDFIGYTISVAPGWTPDDADFTEIYSSVVQQAPDLPVVPGQQLEDKILMPELDIFSAPVSGEATIRITTEGRFTSVFEEQIFIDNTIPSLLSGFPLDGFYSAGCDPLAIDLDADGNKEIILAGSEVGGIIRVHESNGDLVEDGWPVYLSAGDFIAQPIAAGDIDNDGRPELVVCSMAGTGIQRVHIYNHDGTEVLSGWPLDIPNRLYYGSFLPIRNSPVLADVTSDGRMEILLAVQKNEPETPSCRIVAFDNTAAESRVYEVGTVNFYISQPAVGDVDGDGDIEIIALSVPSYSSGGNLSLFVWESDGTVKWSEEICNPYGSPPPPPILVDINDDNVSEILIGSNFCRIYAFDGNGDEIYTYGTMFSIPNVIAAQLRPVNDPTTKNIIISHRQNRDSPGLAPYIKVLNAEDGTVFPGWDPSIPLDYGNPGNYQPVVADFRGDTDLEIGFGNNYPPLSYDGPLPVYQFNIFEYTGVPVDDGDDLWPLYLPNYIVTNPLVTDLDNDSDLDLIIQTDRPDRQYYAFDLATTATENSVAWGEYQHDPYRTGNYNFDIKILSPTTVEPVTAGVYDNIDDQRPFLIRVKFTLDTPEASSDEANWNIKIGEMIAPIIEINDVQAEKWILIGPVVQPAAGNYNLLVQYDKGEIITWDSYKDAVRYESEYQNHTQIALIDRSGSMGSHDKIEAARIAARFFCEAAYEDDEVGVVSFNTEARNNLGTGLLTAGTHREEIADSISVITAGGRTSIGAGLSEAISLLNTDAVEPNVWGIALVSDGLENTAPYWNRPGDSPPVRPLVDDILADHPLFSIHTIALGPDADQGLLFDIADYTGGTFYPVYLGHSLSIFNRLANVFQSARESIEGTERILTRGDIIKATATWQDSVKIESNSSVLRFALNIDKIYQGGEPSNRTPNFPLILKIIRPGNIPVNIDDADVTFTSNRTDAVFKIDKPKQGVWKSIVENPTSDPVEALLTVSADSKSYTDIVVGNLEIVEGKSLSKIYVYTIDQKGFVKEANYNLRITDPEGNSMVLRLNEMSKVNGDKAKNGIYTAEVEWMLPGSYLINLDGQSITGLQSLSKSIGFYNKRGSDLDNDGLPDVWEKQYQDYCSFGLSPWADNDGDGLDNITEWSFGSNPTKTDTDNDGIPDGEEYKQRTDPTVANKK